MRNRALGLWWMVMLCVCMPSSAARADVTIDRTDPVIEHRTFDPKSPPAEMPKLHPNEAAVTQTFFGAESRIGGAVVDQSSSGASIKIDTVRMTLRLRITVWVPESAVPKIVNHEEGHRQISEYYYKDAETIARTQARAMIGRTITGKGDTPDAAGDAALKQAAEELGQKYLGLTDVPSGAAQEYYDQITSHGTNAVKEDSAVKDAIRRAAAIPSN